MLWHLQGQTEVRAFHPDDLDGTRALLVIHELLQADSKRHRRWLGLDTIFLLLSLLLTPVPGPNVLGFYFAFQVVGHLLSIRGARQGLRQVTWNLRPSRPLARLTGLDRLPGAERAGLVREVAGELGLPRLPRFFERTLGETA